jgi:hypothetical protein
LNLLKGLIREILAITELCANFCRLQLLLFSITLKRIRTKINSRKKLIPREPRSQELKAKIIALYLPQFHTIPENDQFWGKGFTEWTNVKKAKKNFSRHYQPHIPLEKNYYDLSNVEVMDQQMQMAKNFGIDAFALYYYLFDGKQLLEKPINNLLNHPEIDFPFFLIWGNENWTRSWDGQDHEILLKQSYSEGWEKVFTESITPYLSDKRYFKFNDKSVVGIYIPSNIPNLSESIKKIRNYIRSSLAIDIFIIGSTSNHRPSFSCESSGIDAKYSFPPNSNISRRNSKTFNAVSNPSGSAFHYSDFVFNNSVENNIGQGEKYFRTVFPSWDNTPRRGAKSRIIRGGTPKFFQAWIHRELMSSEKKEDLQEDLLFINAWNEWGEGCHLEPDEKYGHEWLRAVRNARKSVLDDLH